MKAILALIAFASVLSCPFCLAQTNEPASDSKPATTNQHGREHPQVNSEGRVQARIVASLAQKVELDISGKRFPMTKGKDGAWIGDPRANVEALKDAGVHSVFYVSPDTAHERQTWRRSLHEFAPLLFQDGGTTVPVPIYEITS